MKRIWIQRIGAAVLCAVLLAGCMPGGPAADNTASSDPLTGQEQQYPGQRPAAVVIDNAPGSTHQWGIGSASVVLEAAAVRTPAPSLCLVYPSVSAMPTVGPVTLGQDLFWRLLSGQQVLPIPARLRPVHPQFSGLLEPARGGRAGNRPQRLHHRQYRLGQPAVVHQRSVCGQGAEQPEPLGPHCPRTLRNPQTARRKGTPRRTHCPGPAASADRRPPAGCGRCRRSPGGSTVPVRQHHPLCLRYRHRHLRDAAQ